MVFYVLANNLHWHNKQPRMAYNIHGENSERARDLVTHEFHAHSEISPRTFGFCVLQNY